MRKSKFRAWDGNSMLSWSWISKLPSRVFNLFNGGFPYEKVMQWVGFHDRNGTEIYEGDIVKVKGFGGLVGEVIWDKIEYIIIARPYDRKIKYRFYKRPISDPQYFCEVVGNIYETPELLYQKKLGWED